MTNNVWSHDRDEIRAEDFVKNVKFTDLAESFSKLVLHDGMYLSRK